AAPARIPKSLGALQSNVHLEPCPGKVPLPGRLFREGRFTVKSRSMKILARLVTLVQGAKSRWRNLWYRILGVKLGGYVWMRRIEIPRNYRDIQIDAGAALDRGVVLLCTGPVSVKIRIGSGT